MFKFIKLLWKFFCPSKSVHEVFPEILRWKPGDHIRIKIEYGEWDYAGVNEDNKVVLYYNRTNVRLVNPKIFKRKGNFNESLANRNSKGKNLSEYNQWIEGYQKAVDAKMEIYKDIII